jgi:hypothetical protein
MVTYDRSLYTFRRSGRAAWSSQQRSLSPYAGQLTRNRALKGILYQQTAEGLRKVSTLGSIGMQDIVEQAALGTSGDLRDSLTAFSKALKFRASRKAGMLTIHEQIGAQAQQAILSSYDSARAFSPLSYRVNDRYAGGKLRAAIADPNFYIPQPDGLLFINKGLLDQKAKQWYRLNFGAGLAGHNGHSRDLSLVFAGQNTGLKIGLERFGPSAPFDMPPGVFGNPSLMTRGGHHLGLAPKESETSRSMSPLAIAKSFSRNQGGPMAPQRAARIFEGLSEEFEGPFGRFRGDRGHRDPFTPLSQVPDSIKPKKAFMAAARPTYGITPELFFEAGIRSLAQTLPAAYLRLARTWFEEAVEEGRGPASKSGATAENLGSLVRRGV